MVVFGDDNMRFHLILFHIAETGMLNGKEISKPLPLHALTKARGTFQTKFLKQE